jgi:hypothetical protein
MTKLEETLKAVREENLSKEQLDYYYSELGTLRSQIKMELSGILKEKAIFMLKNPEKSVAQRKIEWHGSVQGLREIELKSYVSALGDQLESVKTRIYSLL